MMLNFSKMIILIILLLCLLYSQLYQKDMEIFYIDFFKEFIGSGITSLIMEELREKTTYI